MKKSNIGLFIGIGSSMGVSFGVAFGSIYNNIGIGVGVIFYKFLLLIIKNSRVFYKKFFY